jgi:hypothetical protein
MRNTLSKHASDWREGRRLRAWELKEKGYSGQRIADALVVCRLSDFAELVNNSERSAPKKEPSGEPDKT